jgi:CubicO group peptidase (beta-lactamase class C family)
MTMRLTAILTALFALLFLAAPAAAQDAKGDWQGTLQPAPTAKLRLALHIAGADGTLTGTMDSIDQGAFGIPLAAIVQTADRLSFTVPAVGGTYAGQWNAEAKEWRGTWSQAGMSWPLVFAPHAPTAPPPPPPENWDIPADPVIAALIDARIADRPGEGIVIGVIEPAGRRIVARGPAGGTAFNGKTVFEIGSMSKVFTSLLLADMIGRGEVALDDPAAKYLPAGAHMPERGGKQITLRDLATHSSGLPRLADNMPFGNPANPYADYTEQMMLDFLGRYQLPRDIGSKFEYSNLGVGLLGYLLARRAGMDYETLLKQRVLIPLGMADTAITLSADQKARFAQGYDATMRPAAAWDLPTLAGAGAIRSTGEDMLAFLSAAMGTRQTSLAPAFQRMLAQRWPGPGTGVDIGLAWMVAKAPRGEVVFHDGGTGGFRTTMAYDPAKKRGVIVLTNAAREPSSNDLAIHLLLGTAVTPP